MADNEARAGGLRPYSEVVEQLGFGWGHCKATFIGGGVWLADGAELLLIGTVTRAVSNEWGLKAWERGMVVSVVFVGIAIGNAMSGPFGDSWGRKLPIQVSYLTVFIFSIASALVQDVWSLMAVRLVVGASFGIGQPAWTALSTEISPAAWRIPMQAMGQTLFVFGELYSAWLVYMDDPEMKNLDWRWLLIYGAIPSLVLFFLSFMLIQSPPWLSLHGHHEEAVDTLRDLAVLNGKPKDDDYHFAPPPKVEVASGVDALSRQYGVVFGPKLRYSTMVMIYSCFEMNLIFYGCLYAFPQVVADIDMGTSPAVTLMIGAAVEVPGFLLGVVFALYLARKPCIFAYLILIIIALVFFVQGATAPHRTHADEAMLHTGYIGIKVIACIGFVVIYQYSTEIYPTVARATGSAVCLAGGRVGGMLAPLTFELLQEHTGTFSTFFYLIACFALLNIGLVVFMPTIDVKKLSEHHDAPDETTPIKP